MVHSNCCSSSVVDKCAMRGVGFHHAGDVDAISSESDIPSDASENESNNEFG